MTQSPAEKQTILIVDDTPENLTLLRTMLTDQGYRIRPAINGEIALKAIRSNPPDLILLDIMMPNMNGYDVCTALKASSRTQHIPIIFISALSEVEDIVKAFQVGGVDYITKPFQAEEVLARVRMHLELQNAIFEKKAAHALLKTILDSIENCIVTVDDTLRIINSNRPLEEICSGFQRDETSFAERLRKGEGPCAEVLRQTLKTQKPVKEHRVTCSCGNAAGKTLVLNTAPLSPVYNSPGGAVLVIRDITRLAELEKSLLEKHRYHNIIGKNEKMREIYSLLERTADLDVNMLICGSSGTGKELIAEAIHYGGSRASGPLVKVNCAALSESLLESELFGHVRGAFTGAVKDRIGRFQAAHGGTLFLDEIGDISPRFQAKLLRVLEHKEFERIGDSETLKADFRVVAATNQDLWGKIKDHAFREDLFYRLKGVLILLPDLKERGEDIPLLTRHFIRMFRGTLGKNIESISDEVRKIFMKYSWPGNIRELKSVLYHACALCPGEVIQKEHLPSELVSNTTFRQSPGRKSDTSGQSLEKASEKEIIRASLEKTDWNKAKAARLMGISRATLYSKLLKYDIKP